MSQPFQKLLNDRGQSSSLESSSLFLGQVADNWRANQNLCPFLVQAYLSRFPTDCNDRIKRLFWIPFFRDPARYLACHYSDTSGSLFERAENLLEILEFGTLLAGITSPKHAITENEELVSPNVFQVQVVDELDLYGLTHVWQVRNGQNRDFKLNIPKQGQYRVFLVHFSGDKAPQSQEETETQTQVGDKATPLMKVGFHIRDALKIAPPLQPGREVAPTVTNVRGLLDLYLKDTVELPDSAPLEQVNELLQTSTGHKRTAPVVFPTGTDLTAFFEQLKIRHTSGSKLHQLTVQLCRSIVHIGNISNAALIEIPQLLAYRRLTTFARPRKLLGNFGPDTLASLENVYGIESNQTLSRIDRFCRLEGSQALKEDGGDVRISTPVRFHFLVQGFDVVSFRATHTHLSVIDSTLADILHRWRVINADKISSAPGRWLATHLSYLDGVAEQLIRAYEENCDPLWKAWALHRAFSQIFWVVSVHFGKVEVDEDIHAELLKLAFSYIDPPHVASVFAFITEFLGPTPRDWANHENEAIGSIGILLQRLMRDWFPNNPGALGLWTLARQLQRHYFLAFRQAPEKLVDAIPFITAKRFFALLTGLSQDDIVGMSGIRRRDDRSAPVLAIVPDDIGRLGATVLSLCDIPSGASIVDVCNEDGKRNLAVAVWSSTLNEVPGLLGHELRDIQNFFQEVDRAREESPFRDVLPRVRIILYHDTNPGDKKKITLVTDAIKKAATNPREPLYGVKLIPWSINEAEVAKEVKAVLREELAIPETEVP
jgi:hypothetical protein